MIELKKYDVFLIGGGIMSTTLGTLINHLEPSWKIGLTEKLDSHAKESSGSFNNAGTGHSGFCELNYSVEKAIAVCEAFEQSKQFWSYLVSKGRIKNNFIHSVPHISFVQGQENIDQLKERWSKLKESCLFSDMEFTQEYSKLKQWMPLVMHSRRTNTPIAATRMQRGVDVDFGALTDDLIQYLKEHGTDIFYNTEVLDIERIKDGWRVITNKEVFETKFLFIGAGGAALTLLEKTGIPEVKGYGGFPVSGQFLMCDNPEVVEKHQAKVYGKPEIGAPPMSVPHLDTRIIDGKKVLLFGPYAGFSPKFLKSGHWTDFFKSLRLSNIFVILSAGLRNLGLSKYLFKEVTKSHKARFKTLLSYYPNADIKDWKLIVAGQRVQVIKRDKGIPTIEFGTEIVKSQDGSLAALLGASPGASTSVKVMIDLLEECFPENWEYWSESLKSMIPSHDEALNNKPELFEKIETNTNNKLGLTQNKQYEF